MRTIGNIITENKRSINKDLLLAFDNIDNVNNNNPTLIIGFENAKRNISNFDILKKDYIINGNKVYWTFKKNERKYDYDVDVNNFYKICFENIVNSISYNYINIVNLNFKSLKKLVSYFANNNDKYIYIHNNRFVFIYDSILKQTMGVSLSLLEYVGINPQKVKHKIFTNSKNHHVYKNTYEDFYLKIIINENPYLIPYIEYYFRSE